MKILCSCTGECCVCACGDSCIAGHGDDFYHKATAEQVIKRIKEGRFPSYRQDMIDFLKTCGIDYKGE